VEVIMTTHRTTARIMTGAMMALLLSLPRLVAAQQCDITGPSALCGGTINLCGPADAIAWEWLFPDGSMEVTQCIDVTVPGLYQLHTFDLNTGDWGPWCQHPVSSNSPAPTIDGPDGGCAGQSVSLCGPTGSYEYQWSCPGGSTASTACFTASTNGDYSLRVRPLPDGCWSDMATRTVSFALCQRRTNCPRSAWWWAQQVPGHDQSGERLDSDWMGQIADCVNDHDTFFDWASPSEGFRQTFLEGHRTLKMRAARQVAAVWANVCATDLSTSPRRGDAVSLDPTTPLTLPGSPGTVGDWLAWADGRLTSLDHQREQLPAVKAAYRELIAAAWHINHGQGIGPVCSHREADDNSLAPMTSADASTLDPGTDPELLSAEMIDESVGPLVLGSLSPNPFTTMTRMAFSVSTSGTENVSIGVYDLSGRLVRELVSGPFAPGQYEARWDGRASDGSSAKAGLYFILGRIGGAQVQTRVTFVH
jgi:hypothetical protein